MIARFTTVIVALVALMVYLSLPGLAAAQDQGRLVVEIGSIPAAEGYAMVAVYDAKEAYNGSGGPVAKAGLAVSGAAVRAVFEDLAYGWYAVAVYHDRNGNGELDKGVFGIPKEAYGHSNNVRGTFGPPAFEDIKFKLGEPQQRIDISLK